MGETDAPVTATPASSARPRIVTIDIVRGFAILWVVLYHLWTDVRFPNVRSYSSTFHAVAQAVTDRQPFSFLNALGQALLRLGFLGVPLFMILSGLSLTLVASRGSLEGGAGRFLRRRLRRVLVPYWFGFVYTAVVFTAVVAYQRVRLGPDGYHFWVTILDRFPDAGQWIAGLLLVPRVLKDTWQFAPEGSLWFVVLILQYYLLFPWLFRLMRRIGVLPFVLAALVVTVVSLDVLAATEGNLFRGHRYYDTLAPFRIFEFAVGMAVGHLLATRADAVRRVVRLPSVLLGVGVGVVLIVLGLNVDLIGHLSSTAQEPLLVLGLAAVFLPLLFLRESTEFKRHPATRALAWTGVASYPILVASEPLRKVLTTMRFDGTAHVVRLVWVWGLYLPVSLLVARGIAAIVDPHANTAPSATPVEPEAAPQVRS